MESNQFSFSSKIRYSELAEDQKLSIPGIINYFQDASMFQSESKNIGLSYLKEHHAAWVLTEWQLKINRRPALGEEVIVTTWAHKFHYFIGDRSFTLTDKNNELLCYAISSWAYLDTNTGFPAKLPNEEIKGYGVSAPIEGNFSSEKLKKSIEMEKKEPITVTNVWLDTNHHMNNGRYIALAKEYLPESFIIKSIRAEYKEQVLCNEIITPAIAKTKTGYMVAFTKENGKLCFLSLFESN